MVMPGVMILILLNMTYDDDTDEMRIMRRMI